MIRIYRTRPPGQLKAVRERALPALRKHARAGHVQSEHADGYQCVRDDLWRMQHKKCCYCEHKCRMKFHDVEHYRPKARADRRPGSSETYGYWWLAFTWKNLLFACPTCNRNGKNDRFPLAKDSTPLAPETHPPGSETPLLVDPAAENPVLHIEFALTGAVPHWRARPRNGSVRGNYTIDVCDLNCADLLELRDDYVETTVRPRANDLTNSLTSGDEPRIQHEYRRACGLLAANQEFTALAYDALRHLVPDSTLLPWKLSWPEPADMERLGRRNM